MNSSKFAGLALGVDKTQRMPLMHPVTGQVLRAKDTQEEAYIEGYSTDSKIGRDFLQELQRRRLNAQRNAGGRDRTTPEQQEAENVDFLAILTTGWSLVTLDGEPLDIPFNQQNARELYAAREVLWIRDQWNTFVSERANFPQSSSQSSSNSPSSPSARTDH